MYYRTCPNCGSNLDPGERCTCRDEYKEYSKRVETAVEQERKSRQYRFRVYEGGKVHEALS